MQEPKKEYQKVINYLRKMISEGNLKIGSRLPTERELSEKLCISRNSTREALRTLEIMGVIESKRGSGNYITGDVAKPVSSMIDMMLLLEQIGQDEICSFRRSLDKAICLSLLEQDIDIATLKSIKASYEASDYTQPINEQIEADHAFHYALIHATNNQLWIHIAEAIMHIYGNIIRIIMQKADPLTLKTISETHIQIIHALIKRNRKECEKWIDCHYDIVDNELKRG
ncbi:MAG: GntR family transcriptional regulator [Eubacteriales bacterium]|nr:GntR family transcriptional regulator [Lachnospiraceae bacterium]MDO5127794.1 GntR family transcriptional regulator [Eubacteriales bacterium]